MSGVTRVVAELEIEGRKLTASLLVETRLLAADRPGFMEAIRSDLRRLLAEEVVKEFPPKFTTIA